MSKKNTPKKWKPAKKIWLSEDYMEECSVPIKEDDGAFQEGDEIYEYQFMRKGTIRTKTHIEWDK